MQLFSWREEISPNTCYTSLIEEIESTAKHRAKLSALVRKKSSHLYNSSITVLRGVLSPPQKHKLPVARKYKVLTWVNHSHSQIISPGQIISSKEAAGNFHKLPRKFHPPFWSPRKGGAASLGQRSKALLLFIFWHEQNLLKDVELQKNHFYNAIQVVLLSLCLQYHRHKNTPRSLSHFFAD